MWFINLEKTYSGHNRQKWPKKGNFRLINRSSCIEKPLGKLHALGNSVHTQFNTEQKVTTEFPDKQQPSMDRWLSFGGITTITNEPGPGIEPHFAKIMGNYCAQKRRREKEGGPLCC